MRIRILIMAVVMIVGFYPINTFSQKKDSTYNRKENAEGVKKIFIGGKFWVWTQKIGNGKINVLLLHGGPGQSHEYFEIFSRYLPKAGITIYYYDQFGSYFSQTPTYNQLKDSSIWQLHRYVDEIDQVRKGLHLQKLFIYGHSYGALLALAYTMKYQRHVNGLIFSDMNPYPNSFDEDIMLGKKRTDSIMNTLTMYQMIMQNKNKGLSYDTAIYQDGFDKTFTRNFVLRLDSLCNPPLFRTGVL